jgi:hypothetical protein
MQPIVGLGAGFAGLWSPLGAARALDERPIGQARVEVTAVNAPPWHSIRVKGSPSKSRKISPAEGGGRMQGPKPGTTRRVSQADR